MKYISNLEKSKEFKLGMTLVKRNQLLDAQDQFFDLLSHSPHYCNDILINLYRRQKSLVDFMPLSILIAEVFIYNKRYSDAFYELIDCVSTNPEYDVSYYTLGKIYQKGFHQKEIIAAYEKAFEKNIFEETIINLLPKIYLERNQIKKAINFFNKLIEHNQDNISYRFYISELLIKNREFISASQKLREIYNLSPEFNKELLNKALSIIKLDPQQGETHFLIGELFTSDFQITKAIHHFQMYLNINPNKTDIILQKYKSLLETFPENTEISIEIASILIYQNETCEASLIIEKIKNEAPQIIKKKINLLEKIIDNNENLIHSIDQLIELYLISKSSYKIPPLIQLLLNNNEIQPTIVEEKIRALISKEPGLKLELLHKLIILFTNNKQFENAHKTLDQLKKLQIKGNEKFKIETLHIRILESEGLFLKAHNQLLSCLKTEPLNEKTNIQLKQLYDKQLKKMIIDLDNSEDIQKNYKKGYILFKLSRYHDALELFQTVTQNEKSYKKSQYMIARIYFEMGQYQITINHIKTVISTIQNLSTSLLNHFQMLLCLSYIFTQNIAIALDTAKTLKEDNNAFPFIDSVINYLTSQTTIDSRGIICSGIRNKQNQLIILNILNNSNSKSLFKNDIPSFALPHNQKGIEYLLKNNYEKAKEELILSSHMDPYLSAPLANLATLNMITENNKEAEKYILKAINKEPENSFNLNTYALITFMEDKEKTKDLLKKALLLDSNNILATFNLGQLFLNENKYLRCFELLRNHTVNVFYLIML